MAKFLVYDGVEIQLDERTDIHAWIRNIDASSAGSQWVPVEDHQGVTHRVRVGPGIALRLSGSTRRPSRRGSRGAARVLRPASMPSASEVGMGSSDDRLLNAPVLAFEYPAEDEVVWPCNDCLPWHVEVVKDPEDGEILIREWHAIGCNVWEVREGGTPGGPFS